MDRNDRARIMWRAEAHERRTKRPRCRNGDLGYAGISVLRTIAFRYWCASRRAAWPSYDTLQAATGYCRQTIATAIGRLERAGLLLVLRRAGWRSGRLVRETNLYHLPAAAPAPPPCDESLRRERKTKTQEIPMSPMLAAALAGIAGRLGLAMPATAEAERGLAGE